MQRFQCPPVGEPNRGGALRAVVVGVALHEPLDAEAEQSLEERVDDGGA